jgi:cell division inhibitor SepF
VVIPTSFNHAQEVADKFKADQPVAMDLLDVDRELSRRLIDFSSGLCYGIGGKMEKVANHVYLLTPPGVEVTPDELRRLADRSYADT